MDKTEHHAQWVAERHDADRKARLDRMGIKPHTRPKANTGQFARSIRTLSERLAAAESCDGHEWVPFTPTMEQCRKCLLTRDADPSGTS